MMRANYIYSALLLSAITSFIITPSGATAQSWGRIGSDTINGNFLEQQRERQQEIEKWYEEAEPVIQRFGEWTNHFSDRVQSIIEQGANCRVIEQKYQYSASIYGENDNRTRWAYQGLMDCQRTRKYRLEALKNIEAKLRDTRRKIEDLDFQRQLAKENAENIRTWLDQSAKDLQFFREEQNKNSY